MIIFEYDVNTSRQCVTESPYERACKYTGNNTDYKNAKIFCNHNFSCCAASKAFFRFLSRMYRINFAAPATANKEAVIIVVIIA
jgi:hypothetical protein